MGDALIVRRTISGGGLSSADAVLIVSVPTGATVTATKNSVTLTPTIWVQSADNTYDTAIFSVSSSTFDASSWTVTATLGGNSDSDTVVIDSNKEYKMALLGYEIVIYNAGTIADGLTTTITNTNGTATFASNRISFTHNGSSNAQPRVTFYPIDLTIFDTLEATVHGANTYNVVFAVYIATNSAASVWDSSYATKDVSADANSIFQMDISSYSGTYYVGIASTTNNATWGTARSGQYCSKIRVFS